MYGATEHVVPQNPKSRSTTISTAREIWPLILVLGLYTGFSCIGGDLGFAVMRSMIHCDTPVPHNGHCPKGTMHVKDAAAGHCVPVQHTDLMWSGSAHCADTNYVMNVSTSLQGRLVSGCGLLSLLAMMFIGGLLIDNWGRKPVMMLAMFGTAAHILLAAIASVTQTFWRIEFMCLGSIVGAALNAFGPASMAMAADLTAHDPTKLGQAYTVMSTVQHFAVLTGVCYGFVVLQWGLSDYSKVMGILCMLDFFVLMLAGYCLTETLPKSTSIEHGPMPLADQLAVKSKPERCSSSSWRSEIIRACRLLCQDHFLLLFMPTFALGGMTIGGTMAISNSFAMSQVKLRLSVASLAGLVQPFCMMLGSASSSTIMNWIGPYKTSWVGDGIAIVGVSLAGLAAPIQVYAGRLYWSGLSLVGVGFGISMVAEKTMLGLRANKEVHGKLFSLVQFFGTIGTSVGAFLWTNYLFSSTWEGWHAGISFFVSGAVFVVVIAWRIALYFKYIVPEMSASATANESSA
eukprot:gnl/TRDRNA2_/TRDRNA2_186184_c0_seq1.p1 gnl/TRDRNA2_/TRDRNA2_186184_c0~~gnl/TRDRNA2_/TRDRNA2_186184_c0_seq1.p1  ORF type:complete len:516 (+),score=52.62 gnl/TRDRNA2_/TRDRNA2_186184_c0_seq1:118-1665(+)